MKFLMRKKFWVFFLIFIIVVIFFFQQKRTNQAKNKGIYKIATKDLKEELSLSGQIEAEEKVSLRFQTSGRLAWVGVKEGDYVRKYQTIARLDQRDLKNRLQKYLNTYVNQRYSFEQTKDDNWQKQFDLSEVIRTRAERVLKQNQLNLENTVLDVEYQNLAIEFANLFTPIEGIITKIQTPYAGVNITPAQAEFEVINPKTLYFSVTADQTEVVNLKEGQNGVIVFDSFPEKEFTGEIYWIAFTPKTGETGTVYQIKMRFDPENINFKIGMSGDVSFLIKEKKNVLSVPLSYLKSDRKGDYVNVLINGKTKKVYVKKGEEIDGSVVIEEGLQEGDLIVN